MVLEHSNAVMFYRYGVTRNSRASILAKQDVVGDVLWIEFTHALLNHSRQRCEHHP